MIRHVKVIAADKADLRDFLSGSGVDFGCRAMAWAEGDEIAAIALASPEAVEILTGRATATRRIELRDALPDPRTRFALVSSGNRFLGGDPVRGYAERIDP